MCKPASFVVTQKRVLWSTLTDSHEEIIAEYCLHEGAPARMMAEKSANFVRVEIAPPGRDMSLPPRQWIYRLDQDFQPDWYDADETEKRCRVELKKWRRHKVVKSGHRVAKEGNLYLCGNATGRFYDNATGAFYGNATGRLCDNARGAFYGNATGKFYGNATGKFYDNARGKFYGNATGSLWSKCAKCTAIGPMAVIVDRTGARAKCTVGK